MLDQLREDGLAKIHGPLSQASRMPPKPSISGKLNSNRSRHRLHLSSSESRAWLDLLNFSPDSTDPKPLDTPASLMAKGTTVITLKRDGALCMFAGKLISSSS